MDLIAMIPDISLDQIRRYFVSHCPGKIPILPKFSSPQFLPHLGKFLKYLAGRYALQHTYYLRNRISWRKTHEYVNMVRCDSHLLNLKTIILRYFRENLSCFISYILSFNPFPIFWGPDQMIFCVVNSVSSSFDSHGISYITFHLFATDAPFIPVHRTGFSGAILINGVNS